MTVTTPPASRAITAALIVLFWLVGASLVELVHVALEPRSTNAAAAATIAAILLAAYGYVHLCRRQARKSDALGVGVVWLALSIAAELVMAARLGDGWSVLVGSPAQPSLRQVLLFVWVFAPAIFARREDEET